MGHTKASTMVRSELVVSLYSLSLHSNDATPHFVSKQYSSHPTEFMGIPTYRPRPQRYSSTRTTQSNSSVRCNSETANRTIACSMKTRSAQPQSGVC